MQIRNLQRLLALLLAASLVATACGGSDDEAAQTDDSTAEAETSETTEAAAASETDQTDETGETDETDVDDDGDMAAEVPAAFDLSEVCPSTLVIQTDWCPESEHGALYQMVGDGYTIDAEAKTVTGPLWAPGMTPSGINIEVRAGGPAIGFAAPRVQMATDDSIHLGYSNTESQAIAWAELPLISVMAPLEKNPQMIMWDPDENPDIETIADLGEAGVTINIFGGDGYANYFVAQGIWSNDQIDRSYDGSPARFVADPSIAQQGFASAEPYNYLNVFEEYGKEVKYQLLHDAGFEVYSQTLAVEPSELENLRPCLEKFIPIVQQSVVDFSSDPARAIGVIVDTVETFNDSWTYGEGIAEYSVATMSELGLHGNGPDDTVGNMEAERIQKIIDQGRDAGLAIPEDLVADDMFTNEFIDPSIGF